MKKTLMTFTLCSLFTALTFAQGLDIYFDISQLMKENEIGIQYKVDRLTTLAGSPYVYDEFQQGRILAKGVDTWLAIEVNKNAYTNLFEFKYDEEIYEMPNYIFDSLFINNSLYIPVSIKIDDAVEIFSMEIVASDRKGNLLLKNEIVKFMDRVEAKPFIDATPAHYKKFPPSYYLSPKDSEIIKIDNLKALCTEDFVPQDLESFIRRNRLKRRNERDLKRIFEYIFITSN